MQLLPEIDCLYNFLLWFAYTQVRAPASVILVMFCDTMEYPPRASLLKEIQIVQTLFSYWMGQVHSTNFLL